MPKTPPVDADAQAFLTAAAITDPTISGAINTLVVQMKADNIWSKMRAVYPMVGGTANSHKFNLKDPRDLDAAFRIVFNGGWTHSANGATPNGTNGFADTFFIPSTHLTTSSLHFSKYNRTNDLIGNKVDGALGSTLNSYFQHNYSAGNAIIGEISAIMNYTPTDTRGFFLANRKSTTNSNILRNSIQLSSSNATITEIPNRSIYLGARQDSSPVFYNSYQTAFSSIGDGLTDTEAANLYTRVQAFQTALSRQI